MFSLHYRPDYQISYKDTVYSVNMAFDVILRVLDLLEEQISDVAKIHIALKMLIGDSLENETIEERAEIFNTIFQTFVVSKQKQDEPTRDLAGNILPEFNEDKKAFYSLKHDAEFIYSSFMQAYNIDLIEQQGKLDWYKFQALLSGLPEDTKFRQVVSIRMWKPPSKHDNEKQQMKELQEYYKLPED